MRGLAVRSFRCSGDEGNVESKVADRRNVFGRVAIYQLDQDAGLVFVVGPQQVGKEARCERGKDADLDATIL
jgi:hypothetical protein